MLFITTNKFPEVIGGVEIFSPTGILIVSIGMLFTVGIPLIMILKGKKD